MWESPCTLDALMWLPQTKKEMKTAEKKVKKVGIYPEDFISSSGYLAVVNLVNDLDQKASSELKTAIDLLSKSDQQNKEKDAEIQRLTTEKKELEEKLMSEQIENGYLQAFRVSNEAEIQRLTKEVEELRETKVLRDAYANKIERQNLRIEILKKDVGTLDSELTRLRELLRRSIPVLDRKNRYYTNLLADIDSKLKQ